MTPVEIGCIVDWTDLNCRFRGLVIDLLDGVASIVVVGSETVYKQHKQRLVPVRSCKDFLEFSNPK